MRKIATLFTFAIFILTSCATATSNQGLNSSPTVYPTLDAKRSTNFSFTFSDTPCGTTPVDVFESSTNTLIHTSLGNTKSTSMSLQLTDTELDKIYQKAGETNFFYLPSKITPPDSPIQVYQTPSGVFELAMKNDTMKNSVSWNNHRITDPLYKEAADFQELINFIRDIIRSHKEYKQLPEPEAGCV